MDVVVHKLVSSSAPAVCYTLTFLLPQSVYGLQNDIRTHSPTHVPAPEAKLPTAEELQEQVSSARSRV